MLFLHDQAVREYGGMQGLKDEGLLQASLGRPRNALYYGEPQDILDLAAAYAFALATSHPFQDGNKRTAWASCVLFLKVNGVEVRFPAPDIIDHMLALVQGSLDEAGFAAWLRGGVRQPASFRPP